LPLESTKNRGLLELTLNKPAALAGARKDAIRISQPRIPRAKRLSDRFSKSKILGMGILPPLLETPRLEDPQHLSSVTRLSGYSPDL
jgi:hypothetical protein